MPSVAHNVCLASPWVPTSVVPLATTTPAPDEAPSGFVCQHCQQYNFLRSAGETWYTVTAGRNVGVFRGWYDTLGFLVSTHTNLSCRHRVQSLVSGVPHASYRKYSSEAAATAAFEDAQSQGVVVVIM
jgi:hypothetical protein